MKLARGKVVSWALILESVFLPVGVNASVYGVGSVGQSTAVMAKGTSAGDVAWQQRGFPHSENLSHNAYGLGIGYAWRPWLSTEVAYHDLGVVSQRGEWARHDDGSLNETCPCSGEGAAPVKGWTLAGVGRYPIGRFSIGLEMGAFKWQSAWRETIRDNQGNITYHEPVKTSGVGALTGVVFGYGALDLRYEMFHVQPRDGIFDRLRVLRAAYRFNF